MARMQPNIIWLRLYLQTIEAISQTKNRGEKSVYFLTVNRLVFFGVRQRARFTTPTKPQRGGATGNSQCCPKDVSRSY